MMKKFVYVKPLSECVEIKEMNLICSSVNSQSITNTGSGNDGFSGYQQLDQNVGYSDGDQDSRAKGNSFWED